MLVAGRAISTDSVIFCSTRIMPCCLVTGEAAGIAAYETLTMKRIDVHCIDVEVVRDKLRKYGAYIK